MKSSTLSIPAWYLPIAYSVTMGLGLIMSLLLGIRLHFADLTQTHCRTAEYWPSISATTGDFLVERTVWRGAVVMGFGIRIICSLLLFRQFANLMSRVSGPQQQQQENGESNSSSTHWLVSVFGWCDATRIFCALGWTLIASAENLFAHEVSFAFYMIGGFILQLVQVIMVRKTLHISGRTGQTSYLLKKIGLVGQTVCALLVAKFFIDHNATCIAGTYSKSTMFEWGFAFFNLAFDATQCFELEGIMISVGLPVAAAAANERSTESSTVNLATHPSSTALWLSELFFGYYFYSSMLVLYQNVYFIPMVAMRFTPEVLFVCAPIAPLLLRLSFLSSLSRSAGQVIGKATGITKLPPTWVVLYGMSLISLFSFDVTRDANQKLQLAGLGPCFLFAGIYARLQTTSYGTVVSGRHSVAWSEDTSRLVLSFPLGMAIGGLLRALFVSLDPLAVNPIFNAFVGVLGGSCAVAVLYRKATFPLPAASEASSSDDLANFAPTKSCSARYGILAGLMTGSMMTLTLLLCSSGNILVRFLGLSHPFPANLLPPAALAIGAFSHRSFIFGSSPFASMDAQRDATRGANAMRGALRLVVLVIISLFGMYNLSTGSNRMFPTVDIPADAEHLDKVDISHWVVEEMGGSTTLAFISGLIAIAGIGALFPWVQTVAFVVTRGARQRNDNFSGSSGFTSIELWGFLGSVVTVLMQVYVVCFPFVPGGFVVRDRMWLVIAVHVFCVCAPLLILLQELSAVRRPASPTEGEILKDDDKQSQDVWSATVAPAPRFAMKFIVTVLIFAFIFRELGTPAQNDAAASLEAVPVLNNHAPGQVPKSNDPLIFVAQRLFEVEVIGRNKLTEPGVRHNPTALVAAQHAENARVAADRLAVQKRLESKHHQSPSTPYDANAIIRSADAIGSVTAMIWTIHFGLDNYGVDSIDRLTQKVKSTGAGIIGLLETDTLRTFNGNRDVVEYISHTLGYPYVDYGPTTIDSTFGCALITKYKIRWAKRYVMPSPMGELACLIHAELDIGGVPLQTYVGHWGNTDHVQDTKLQSQFLGKLAKANPGPSIFLGYLTTASGYGNYKSIVAPYKGVEGAEGYEEFNGLFRDTAKDLYRHRPWERKEEYGGYFETKLSDSDAGLPQRDQQFRRPPPGEQPRVFYYPDTKRYADAHPRFEWYDRYCQYVLFKTGLAEEETPEAQAKVKTLTGGLHLELLDWWRILEIDELSDTEIQVAQFGLRLNK